MSASSTPPLLASRRSFVGRGHELGRLRAGIAPGSADGPGAAIVVVGEPGIGKTTLIEEALASVDLDRTTVLRASGDEAEIDLDYATLDQLARSTSSPFHQMMSPLAGGPLEVGARFVRTSDEAAPGRHLVLVVDDAQAADLPTLEALTFVVRRVHGDRLSIVLATRPEGLVRIPAGLIRAAEASGGVIELMGFDVDEVGALALAATGRALSTEAATRLHQHTGGHPLHATILLEGPVDLGRMPSMTAVLVERLVSCSPAARQLLDALSVLEGAATVSDVAAIADVDRPFLLVDELVQRALVHVDDEAQDASGTGHRVLSFRHDALRSAVHAVLPLARRKHLHLRAAQTSSSADEALRHRVIASSGPDPELVADLLARADHHARRGAGQTAAHHCFAAADLTSGREREQAVLRGAGHLLTFGRPLGDRLAEIESFSDGAERSAILGRSRLHEGRFAEARVLLEQAWALHHDGRSSMTAHASTAVAENLAVIALSRLDADEVIVWAKRLDEIDGALATTMLCHGLALRGDLDEARHEATARISAASPGQPDVDARLGRGLVNLWSNRLEDARTDLASVLSGPIDHSLLQSITARSQLADVHLRLGHLVEAADLATVSIGLVEDSDAVWLTPLPHSIAAYAHTAAGNLDAAEMHATAASTYAQLTGEAPATIWSEAAWLRLAEARQDHDAAVATGDRMLAAGLETVAEGVNHWKAVYVVALATVGRVDDADKLLDLLQADVDRSGDVSITTEALRARAELAIARGLSTEAASVFDQGLALDPAMARPLPRGQLELAAGRFHRMAGRHTRAAELLRTAAARLQQIGAKPWLEQCRRELEQCGVLDVEGPASDITEGLTPQERVVSRLVAEGRTNKAVAEELYISAKTVEHHLSRVYAKLGVKTRTEMAALLARGGQ